MKRCPECRRDYYDDTLSYCLSDGTELVYGLADDEPATAILSEPGDAAFESEQPTQTFAQKPRKRDETTPIHKASGAKYIATEIKQHKMFAAIAAAFFSLVVAGIGYGIYKYSSNNQNKTAPSPSSAQMKLTRLTATGKATSAAISPDGKYVVYSVSDNGQQSLWMQQTATQSNVQIVPPADVQYARLIFSPDGNYLFYAATERNSDRATLYEIPVLGGSPKKLLSNISNYMALSPDASQIVFEREFADEGIDALIIENVDGANERRLAVRKQPEHRFAFNNLSAPAWSPDGKTIACPVTNIENGNGYSGVVAIDVAGGQEKPITAQKFYPATQTAWLADGSGLLMLAQEQPSSPVQLWQVSYPEGEVRRITNDLNSYRTISLTADSGTLATVQSEQTGSIWIAPQNDVARARQITSGTSRFDSQVRWMPFNKIVFTSNISGRRNVWTMNADGGDQKQLTGGVGAVVAPNGSYIAFSGLSSGISHIYRIDLNGGNVKQLTNGIGESFPIFSPDGRWIFYRSRAGGNLNIWRVPSEGGEPQQLTSKLFSYIFAVSPDGKWLAAGYRDEQENGFEKIGLFPFDGGQPVKSFDNIPLVTGTGQEVHWTPDSRALIYIDTKGGVSNLWSQPIDGGAPKQLTDFKADRIFSFDFSRDGKQLALSRGAINNDVVMISNFK